MLAGSAATKQRRKCNTIATTRIRAVRIGPQRPGGRCLFWGGGQRGVLVVARGKTAWFGARA